MLFTIDNKINEDREMICYRGLDNSRIFYFWRMDIRWDVIEQGRRIFCNSNDKNQYIWFSVYRCVCKYFELIDDFL